MKILSPVALAIVLLLSGCTQVPQETAQRLAQAQKRFKEVKLGMTKAYLITALGQPQKEEGRLCHWEAGYGQMNRELLRVEFDAGGKVVGIKTTHLELNQPSVPST